MRVKKKRNKKSVNRKSPQEIDVENVIFAIGLLSEAMDRAIMGASAIDHEHGGPDLARQFLLESIDQMRAVRVNLQMALNGECNCDHNNETQE